MKPYRPIALIIVGGLLVSACAAAMAPRPLVEESVAFEEPAQAPVPAVESIVVEADVAAGGDVFQEVAPLPAAEERLVIRNASLTVVVPDPATSAERIAQMAEQMGGYVVSSNVFKTAFAEGVVADQASVTIRVPAERLQEALERIKADAVEVRNETVTGQDVTEEYTDLQSRLRNLEAAEEQLLRIMEQAQDTEDVLRVFQDLRQVREEIEVIKGRIQYLEQSARLSAISVDLLPDVAERPITVGRWTPQGTAKAAVETLIRVLRFLADAAIWLAIAVLPVVILLGVPGWLVLRFAVRRLRRPKTTD